MREQKNVISYRERAVGCVTKEKCSIEITRVVSGFTGHFINIMTAAICQNKYVADFSCVRGIRCDRPANKINLVCILTYTKQSTQ